MSHTWLRPVRTRSERAAVSHLFDDDDYWFPWRVAACGREIEAERLTDENLGLVQPCVQCKKHEAKLPA